jgi:uncharacterized tellurite resistance protein B-like protein
LGLSVCVHTQISFRYALILTKDFLKGVKGLIKDCEAKNTLLRIDQRNPKEDDVSLLNRMKEIWKGGDSDPQLDVLRNIISKVEELPVERARFIACFAFLLGRVAYADLQASAEEVKRIEGLLRQKFHLDAAQAVLICTIAKNQNEMFGSTENYLVAREFKEMSTLAERRDLIDLLFQVAAADESISSAEEAEITQMASELEIHRDEMIEIRGRYRRHREVLK